MNQLLAGILPALLAFASSSHGDLTAGAPLTPPDRVAAAHHQRTPDLASNGSEVMALWLDARAGTDFTDLYAARLDSKGKAIDELGLLIAKSVRSGAIAPSGDDFVVAYTTSGGAFFTRVEHGTTSGEPQFIGLTDVVDLETDGSSFCVLLISPNNSSAAAAFVDRVGMLERVVSLPVGTKHMASTAKGYWAVVIDDNFNVSVVPVSRSGVGTPILVGKAPASDTPVANLIAGGNHLLVAWLGKAGGVVTTDYIVLDQQGARITDPIRVFAPHPVTNLGYGSGLSMGWDGSEFLIGWTSVDYYSGYRLRGTRIRPDGTTPEAASDLSTSEAIDFSVGRHHGVTFMVMTEGGWLNSDLVSRHGSSFASMDSAKSIVASSSSHQSFPRVTSIGSTALAIWSEGRSQSNIVGALIGAEGGTTRLVFADLTETTRRHFAAVGASRNQFLAVWTEDGDFQRRIRARRVALDGTMPDTSEIVLNSLNGSLQDLPAVASDGTNFLVVWTESNVIRSALVRPDGTFSKDVALSVDLPVQRFSLSVVWTGSMYLVLWREYGPFDYNNTDSPRYTTRLRMARVTAEGVLLDTTGSMVVAEDRSTSEAFSQTMATSTSGRAVVVWPQSGCLRGMSLAADGIAINAPRTIACGLGQFSDGRYDSVSATWNGRDFTVLWSSGRNRSSSMKVVTVNDSIDATSSVREVLPAGTGARRPSLTLWPAGVLAVYEQLADQVTYGGVRRIFGMNLLSQPAPPRRRAVRR